MGFESPGTTTTTLAEQIADRYHDPHVIQKGDLIDGRPLLKGQLYPAAERADAEDEAVVLNYGHEQLYPVETEDLTYLPPKVQGFEDALGLLVPYDKLVRGCHREAAGSAGARLLIYACLKP